MGYLPTLHFAVSCVVFAFLARTVSKIERDFTWFDLDGLAETCGLDDQLPQITASFPAEFIPKKEWGKGEGNAMRGRDGTV